MVMNYYQKLEETLIQIGLKIAKRGEGAIFVVGKAKYHTMIEQTVPKFRVIDNPKLVESLGMIDGAVIISSDGFVEAYGAKLKSTYVLNNYGTRHSAAFSASKGDNMVILVSEEDKKVKIIRNEKLIMQIDALERNVDQQVGRVINILESIGAGAIGSIGTGLLVPTLAFSFIPGVLVFGSAYYFGRTLHERLKN